MRKLGLSLVLLALVACGESGPESDSQKLTVPAPEQTADTIYSGGDIVTMDPQRPEVEAVAVRGGWILALGSLADIKAAHQGEATQLVDLGGRTLLPGFVDGHSHSVRGAEMIDWAQLSVPPVGKIENIASLLAALHAHVAEKQLRPGDWVVGWGYDQDGLAEKRHITRDDLDTDFPDNPVMLLHVSGHGVVLNSAALAIAGIDANTPKPAGGVIARKPGSNEPAGLLMETAAQPVYQHLPVLDIETRLDMYERMQRDYARNGYTTIQDGASDANAVAFLQRAAVDKRLLLDVVSLPVGMSPAMVQEVMKLPYGSYQGRLKFGGVKVIDDGSPQGKTAFFTEPYLTGGFKGEADWRGEPFITAETYEGIFLPLYKAGIPVWTHANGDAAIDMVIHAHELAGAKATDDRRDVVIHSQFVRSDQLDAYAKYGIGAAFFTNHAFYWGDVHLRNLGEQRANFLSPLQAAMDRGLHFSNHTDYFVTPLDPMIMLWTAVTRQSRSGLVIGADQRVPVMTALKAITLDAAWMYHEEDRKGSIEPGKLADFVVLDRNPLTVEPDALRDLKVVATIKQDEAVYGAL